MTERATETVRPVPVSATGPTATGSETWWSRLQASEQNLTATSLEVLDRDSTYIVDEVAPRENGALASGKWSATRVRTGIVVGSVQSGKTANMLAVAAKALDRGVGLVIVLAGTRIALWLQTYGRVLRNLDGSQPYDAYRRDSARLLIPSPNDVLGSTVRAEARQYLGAHASSLARFLRAGKPAICVVPKEDDHLSELRKMLHKAMSREVLEARGKPLEMLVFDDEADDGSILSAEDADQVTPQYIRHLWSDIRRPSESLHNRLYVTYIAYTATPQANYLQDAHNPLSPRDFHVALRVPEEAGEVEVRTTTYREPRGLPRYYTGGRLFYERFPALCVPLMWPEPKDGETEAEREVTLGSHREEIIGDALRAYCVAGAARLCLEGGNLAGIDKGGRLLRKVWETQQPPQHCMLIHPSAQTDVHFQVAREVYRWSCNVPLAEAGDEETPIPSGLNVAGLCARLETEEEKWVAWLEAYRKTSSEMAILPGFEDRGIAKLEWKRIKQTLVDQVFGNIKLRVLNSDEESSERPNFEAMPCEASPEMLVPPKDVYSIFVAGNVLSRGLTIEGLATSLFVRPSRVPVADTQTQMQRWFGYRGKHLPFCRVFLYGEQRKNFGEYHANDESLKSEILSRMRRETGIPPAADFLVLEGRTFRATAKVRNVQRVPLHPGPTPFIRLVEHKHEPFVKSNLDLVAELLESREWKTVEVKGELKGCVTSEPVELLQVADFLDRLRYQQHAPDPNAPIYARWKELEATWELPQLLTLPKGQAVADAVDPHGCPYSIAAYLRLWHHLLNKRAAKAFFPTDQQTRWHLLNLEEYQKTRPRFYIGIRNGDAGNANDKRLADRQVKAMARGVSEGLLDATWGSRGTKGAYYGDQLFDYHLHNTPGMPHLHGDSRWRRRGHPGLLLFHIVRYNKLDLVAAGLALPHGGPDHIAALRGARGDE